MEDNVRNALIIISTIIIGGFLVHGLWTLRKNKNPYKLKAKKEPVQPLERGFDTSGFDQDGVSEVRVVGVNALTGEIDNPPADEEIPHQPAPAPEFSADPIPKDLLDDNNVTLENEPNVGELQFDQQDAVRMQSAVTEQHANEATVGAEKIAQAESEITEPSLHLVAKSEPEPVSAPEPALYQEPVTQAKPNMNKPAAKKPANKTKKSALKRNQLEINFGDELPPKKAAVKIEPEVLVISVVMSDNQTMSGAVLLPSLLTLGMKYGEMNIFHRHQDNAGNGKVAFSLANMMNPGTFDLDAMESFTTQGVTLFMTLPNEGDPFAVFQQMLAAAKHIAEEFNGQLLDDKRSVLTKQTEQHYTSKIREFDRKSRIAAL